MPLTKNPHLRYRLLDAMLRNTGRTYTFKELLDSLNESLVVRGQKTVSIRQLRADLNYMRSEAGFSAPIEVKKGSNPPVYQYAVSKFQIGDNPMNPQEAAQLRDTLQMLERFDGSTCAAFAVQPILFADIFVLNSTPKQACTKSAWEPSRFVLL